MWSGKRGQTETMKEWIRSGSEQRSNQKAQVEEQNETPKEKTST
jgi:acylphosphatase